MTISNPYSYANYLAFTQKLIDDKALATRLYDESKHEYFHLNLKRMERIDKTIHLNADLLSSIEQVSEQTWVVISEPWCGDSAQILPVIAKVAEESKGKILLKIVLRDAEPTWIDAYLTNGGKSIPKLIAFEGHGTDLTKELFTWGPRPAGAVEVYKAWKAEAEQRPKEDFERDLHGWYAKDKTQGAQQELAALL
jgi:thiol-disulfide isomerase/thioredoxin